MRRTPVLAATVLAALLGLNLAQAQTAASAPGPSAPAVAAPAAPATAPAADASEGKIAYYGQKFAGPATNLPANRMRNSWAGDILFLLHIFRACSSEIIFS